MDTKNDEFRQKLLATFRVEADEHITAMISGLVELERTSDPEKRSAIIETAFREAHSLKGAARAVNLVDVEAQCQALESKFSALKRGQLKPSPELFDELHHIIDGVAGLLRRGGQMPQLAGSLSPETAYPSAGGPEKEGYERAEGRKSAVSFPSVSPVAEKSSVGGSVRIATAKLDSLFLQAEELFSAKLAAQRRAADLRESATVFAADRRKRAELRPELQGLELWRTSAHPGDGSNRAQAHLDRILHYLEWAETQSKLLENSLVAQAQSAEQDSRYLGARVDGLVEEMKRVLMLPFASILELFPRLVRDLSRQQGKEVEWVLQGGEVEVDKRILEEMKDPLIHLLRNAIDHGIEKPQDRMEKKKPHRGHLTLVIASRDSGRIEVQVTDDGAGIDFERVHAAAVKQGIVPKGKFDEAQALSLIFRSGVSTNPILTDISGRGLGLAIVQEKVEKLGGTVRVETCRHAGTTFRIVLPVTLATSRGVLVRAGEHSFILPAQGVERTALASDHEIKTVENRETIELGGSAVAFVRLEDVLMLPRRPAPGANGKHPFLVLYSAGTRVAFQADEILGEQEVLNKNLPKPFSHIPHLAGATVLGTGEVVPILNTADLVKSASQGGWVAPESEAVKPDPKRAKSILVAEDSITSRSLLKGILESAGYTVRTAVDGADAFATLKTEAFDLVVSDVDMPRMSGFDLTAKVRSDKTLANLPVVLVTALESREDRERGIEVGADAYLVKSSFDQSNLLEIIRRLVE